ncbi:MAG: hypothetical protein GFH27_549297n197 [Chloroflexi bacterium AL-W]|nr:hypothetical protein [Chloroflexi bacterium AL-N1]NOK68949.1 hypothetical protein [Chloroflexi bacterium AL-N10]NOK76932.1 hypothetical protein [Chloroflexi bacterium AL-N5]NOK82680.1 hypothetical protein [Chloroflexi bacterium AL-W]NOK90789.1 hypothetical protein [Chloroflexi bacterium AL-N15]
MNNLRSCLWMGIVAILITITTVSAEPQAPPPTQVYLPMIQTPPPPPNPFGFDLRTYSPEESLEYIRAFRGATPRWTRAGDVFWASVEPVRGAGYNWDAIKHIEENVRRLRAEGIEPIVMVRHTPEWAQTIPGRVCSPMKPEYIDDFARFMEALTARYADGPLEIDYWEIWNEPDYAADQIYDIQGVGCWANPSVPDKGGAYYGEVLKRIYPGIKQANPRAVILAGALAYFWPDDEVSRPFLRGMLESGAGNSFDMLSYHAYGAGSSSDLLVLKTFRIRELLAEYGLEDKPLFATEIAATCASNDKTSCTPDFDHWWTYSQANYAARIYAEVMALGIEGALWYTFVSEEPGFAYSHLIDRDEQTLTPRPSYYAFRNSARLLLGAEYDGTPVTIPPPEQASEVQIRTFYKPDSLLHVVWVPELQGNFPPLYNITIESHQTAICTHKLDQNRPQIYPCHVDRGVGVVPIVVNELPRYVEIFDHQNTEQALQIVAERVLAGIP